jgi:predicted NBD/HSP70 family sugar kinase
VRAGGSEYGHIRIGAHGPQCRCGARGCIEASIADYALYRDVRLALGTPAAAPADEAEMAELVALAAAGNARAAAVFDGAAQVLAEGVSILLQLLQPENVVVAGPGVRARALLERVDVVPDRDAVSDLLWLLQAEKVLCEPAASCTVSALARCVASLPADAHVGVVLCGSNIALADVDALKAQFGI